MSSNPIRHECKLPTQAVQTKSHQEKLTKAIEYLGEKYICHTANHVKKKKRQSPTKPKGKK